MRIKVFSPLIFAVLLLTMEVSALSQAVPAAEDGRFQFAVGVGASNFNVDWGQSRLYGGTLWADWLPNFAPFLNGLGVEIEARDLSLGRSPNLPSNFRQDTGGGGVIYKWRHFRNFHPYGKYLFSLGSIDFRLSDPNYTHDTRTVTAAGIGFEYRVFGRVGVRADYEYQFWPDLLAQNRTLDPQGFTVGAMYEFNGLHRH